METECYSGFARVYDRFMRESGVPYERWTAFVHELIERFGVSRPSLSVSQPPQPREADRLREERDLIVDLACGTGSFTLALRQLGYDVCGVDASEEMLTAARENAARTGDEVLFLLQDLRELDLYCTAGTMLCMHDSMNYLLTDEDMLEVLRRINRFLYPGGILIFDFNTLYRYRDVMGDGCYAIHLGPEPGTPSAGTLLWDNAFYDDGAINESTLTFFIHEKNGLYRRFCEVHDQRGYTLAEMQSLVTRAGLQWIAAYDADTHQAPTKESGRILVVAMEQGKAPVRHNAD